MILPGVRFQLIVFLVIIALILWSIDRARRGFVPAVRPLPAVDAIPEIVGRAAEMGKPLHYSTGLGSLHDQYAAMTVSALAILGEVAKECGQRGVPMRYSACVSYLVPVAEDLIKAGYIEGGRTEMYDPDMVVYVGEQQRSLMMSALGYFMRERPAVNCLFGAFFWESEVLLGGAAVIGAVQVGGTPRMYHTPFFIACCNYALVGEELYVAGTKIHGRPTDIGCLRGQDLAKLILMVILAIGIILTTAQTELFAKLLMW